ncbi:hypothetical protein NP233_g1026 [Leucocoprinus birnbaumii]|uniref:CxC2-like cysteine cluster KDZ transposase-associated domain-containing protein n=1 Tax=Leucocoprinus birnbaumii TaxID=56174 RepID=A0AAD5YW83_9AGAR|nr:hypothetical protein NP233_g1026 [Leucocoprinus birnbaumii]
MPKAPMARNGIWDLDHIKPPPKKKARHYKLTELKLGSSGSYPSGNQEKVDRPKSSKDTGKSVHEQEGEGNKEEGQGHKTSRNQTMSARMEPFTLAILALIQAEIIGLEGASTRANARCANCSPSSTSNSPSAASTSLPNTASPSPNLALYRCSDCFHSEETCSDCILTQHRYLPFHRIQTWTGTHFENTTLATLGYVLHLGHEGLPCTMSDEDPLECVIVHTNGIHTLPIGFCKCKPKDHSRLVQLVSSRLFPSTVDAPRTMFTFHVLEDFHRHSLSSKGSAYDYYEALKRHNDAAFPRAVPESTCARLKAVRQQDRVKFKDAVVSGLVGFQCTRHGQWMSQGMVDLEKGETYSRTDYALAHALGMEALRHRWIMLSYDIWCQYHRNLPKRFKEKFDYLLPTIKSMRGAIPKMHIHSHNFQCQVDHSFYYKKYSGMTCGEGIESSWSEQNHAANSTKEANDGHRHDTLDDFNGYWNWCKLVQLDTFLFRQAKRFYERYEAVKESFTSFTEFLPDELREQWQRDSEAAKSNPGLFEINDTCTPSELRSYAELVEGEADADYGLSGFILEGLELEDRLAELKLTNGSSGTTGSFPSDDEYEDGPDLIDRLQNWRTQQSELFPLLRPLPPISEDDFGEVALHLPSSYPTDEHAALGLTEAAKAEVELRKGRGFDILRAMREEIYRADYIRVTRKLEGEGSTVRTRNWTVFDETVERQELLLSRYGVVYGILLKMKAAEGLLPITKSDLWVKSPFQPQQLGDSSRQNPWFWAVGKPNSITYESWLIEIERARWFRERALLERLREELEILNEEFRRTHVSFAKMEEVWTKLAEGEHPNAGYAAYAHRHAAMYKRLAYQCSVTWEKASPWLKIEENASC